MNLKNKNAFLLIILIIALILRFLYFPYNTYFGFDQARTAFAVKEILSGHLKIVGPPTSIPIFHHGVLYYYIFAPFYFISGGDPITVSIFLRILNALGILILYRIVSILFGRISAVLVAVLFAISYEQTQFSLFFNHPAFVVISVLIFYLGLSTWIFKEKIWGFFLTLFGLGLSIQFQFVEIQLIPILILFLLFFRKLLPQFNLKNIGISILSFFLPISTYIIAELKNNLVTVKQIQSLVFSNGHKAVTSSSFIHLSIMRRYLQDNIAANPTIASILGIVFLTILVGLIVKNKFKPQLIFLVLWFFGGILVYFVNSDDAYFYNTGTSIALLIFVAFLINRLFIWNKWISIIILSLIVVSNLYLITKNNPLGPNQRIHPQIGLFLKDEERALDFIYSSTNGKEFAVNALTSPLYINTTWSYLFEWYGKNKYGYLPIWGGDAAAGYPGNLKIQTARSKLPNLRFLIIEPTEGIPSYLVDNFMNNEEKYTSTTEKKNFGTIQVWVQKPK